jgi:hypothetical protein
MPLLRSKYYLSQASIRMTCRFSKQMPVLSDEPKHLTQHVSWVKSERWYPNYLLSLLSHILTPHHNRVWGLI